MSTWKEIDRQSDREMTLVVSESTRGLGLMVEVYEGGRWLYHERLSESYLARTPLSAIADRAREFRDERAAKRAPAETPTSAPPPTVAPTPSASRPAYIPEAV